MILNEQEQKAYDQAVHIMDNTHELNDIVVRSVLSNQLALLRAATEKTIDLIQRCKTMDDVLALTSSLQEDCTPEVELIPDEVV
jgi:hypothetical protein